ncbi:PadR family transcriptional regulator [Saccharothrix syringae]|uniref:NcmI n=1 Tax=Saccharothrix syringae TaxID=103733 RepID=A0A1X9WEP2_SACSY|nr:PadR family transcriptional regulator [Saccharothrix syringae]ARS01482.1 NcmI [Saccharothrix syringae]QFZ19282.1 PadR family transcriptional regulator [Saccharothrix syringae]
MRGITSLGLAVLRLLAERPQHPYEMRQRMREEGLDRIIKVTHGALYHTVEALTKAEYVRGVETTKEGRRPERTVYAITDAGREVALDRLRGLLSTPAPEYPGYCAALAFMSLLPMEDAAGQLEQRCVLLEAELAASQTGYDALVKRGLPPVALVEMRYMQAHLRADLDLTRSLVDDIRAGRLRWQPVPGGTEQEVDR